MFDVFWDDEDGTLTFQYFEGKVFAHAKSKNWNKSVYLKWQDIWHVAKDELHDAGYKEIFVAIPIADKKLIKFEKMFGFTPVNQYEDVLLMVCSTEKHNGI